MIANHPYLYYKLTRGIVNRIIFRSAVNAVIRAVSPNHAGLSQIYMILICRFYPAVAWTVQLLSHFGGDLLQPIEVGKPMALIKYNSLFNL
jgi:hypothetical protein